MRAKDRVEPEYTMTSAIYSSVGQVAALAADFSVEPSYLVDRKKPPTLDAELLAGSSDETT
jgi:hypothetical protein